MGGPVMHEGNPMVFYESSIILIMRNGYQMNSSIPILKILCDNFVNQNIEICMRKKSETQVVVIVYPFFNYVGYGLKDWWLVKHSF